MSDGIGTILLTKNHVQNRLQELNIKVSEAMGEDIDFILDAEERKDIKKDKRIFDAWVEHIWITKEMRKKYFLKYLNKLENKG